jgi:hypothetical protein
MIGTRPRREWLIRPPVVGVNVSTTMEVALVDRSERLVLSVTEAAELLGISRTLAFDLVLEVNCRRAASVGASWCLYGPCSASLTASSLTAQGTGLRPLVPGERPRGRRRGSRDRGRLGPPRPLGRRRRRADQRSAEVGCAARRRLMAYAGHLLPEPLLPNQPPNHPPSNDP